MINGFVEKLRGRLNKELQLADEDKRKADVLQFDRAVGYANGMAIAIDILNQLAEEYKDVPDTNVGKWIPVSEKLPDDFMSHEYLTIRKGRTSASITYYCVVNHKWYSNRKRTKEIDVIAWQNLPQLYKGE